MTITLDVPETVAEQIQLEATLQGLTVDQYLLRSVLEKRDRRYTYVGMPTLDPHLAAAGERVRAAAEELVRLGITDEFGNRLRTDLPEDMQEGADRDFGG